MKRGGRLKRTTPLRADAEVTRAFVQRGREQGREGMKSTALRHATAPSDFRDDNGRLLPARPDKPSAWDERQVAALQRAANGGKRAKRRTKVRIPAGVRKVVKVRSHGACVVCLHRAGIDPAGPDAVAVIRQALRAGVVRPIQQLHHVFPEQTWPALAKTEACLVGCCVDDHMAHEFVACKPTRIPRAALPAETIALADGDGPMENYLARTYPV